MPGEVLKICSVYHGTMGALSSTCRLTYRGVDFEIGLYASETGSESYEIQCPVLTRIQLHIEKNPQTSEEKPHLVVASSQEHISDQVLTIPAVILALDAMFEHANGIQSQSRPAFKIEAHIALKPEKRRKIVFAGLGKGTFRNPHDIEIYLKGMLEVKSAIEHCGEILDGGKTPNQAL